MKFIKTILLIFLTHILYSQNIIYVSSKNDPRLSGYIDSLRLYNFGIMQLNKARALKDNMDLVEGKKYHDWVMEYWKTLNQNIKPIGYNKSIYVLFYSSIIDHKLHRIVWRPDIYKMPEIIVVYKKPVEKETPKQTKTKQVYSPSKRMVKIIDTVATKTVKSNRNGILTQDSSVSLVVNLGYHF